MNQYHVAIEPDVDIAELMSFYQAQNHPAPDSRDKLRGMVSGSACFVTARDTAGRLVGVARGLTDGVRGYLTECKLDPNCQGPAAVTRTDGRVEHDEQGVAREMASRVIRSLIDLGCDRIDVLAYGTEEDFCRELGFRKASGMVAMSLDAAQAKQALQASPPSLAAVS